jgi:hypothetical protein
MREKNPRFLPGVSSLSLAMSTSHGAAFNWISRIRAVQEPMSNFTEVKRLGSLIIMPLLTSLRRKINTYLITTCILRLFPNALGANGGFELAEVKVHAHRSD